MASQLLKISLGRPNCRPDFEYHMSGLHSSATQGIADAPSGRDEDTIQIQVLSKGKQDKKAKNYP